AVFEGYKTVDIGISHGTVGVVKDGSVYEITTFRTDGAYTDSRHPDSVTFTPSLAEDLKRRDFTVNAMAYSEEDGLVDLFFGREDLEKRVIRTVGNPVDRFAEDALRILRGARFAATLGFAIEEKTLSAMHEKAPSLSFVSAERKKEEISKLLCGKNASTIVQENAAVIAQAWQGVSLSQVQENAPLLALLPPQLPLRLAAFFDKTDPILVFKWLSDFRFDKKTAIFVGEILSAKSQMPCKTPPDFRRLLGKYGENACLGALDLLSAQNADFAHFHKEMFTSLLETNACVKVSQLGIDGKALLPYVQGREVGRVLEALLEAVINEKTENEESALLAYARKFLI
ncbi:MAG: tRNA nucleotidyltransferase, partial [Clostridia bacterium]|nr:tRNA nucleotidyltransferase [Clostridia bacterium]